MNRSAQAMALLTATVVVVSMTLGFWLVLWLLFVRPKVTLYAATPTASPVALHAIAGLLPPGVDTKSGVWDRLDVDSVRAIGDRLESNSGQPKVLYLAAPVAGTDHKGEAGQGFVSAETIESLVKACQNRPGNAKLLLIIDPGRVGPDPVVGLKNNRFVDWLKSLENEGSPPTDQSRRRQWDKKWRNFGIFCACSPDQFSWPVEGQGQTIFDKVLNQAFAKPRKVRKTIALVTYWVDQLVPEFIRGAFQTPMYLGDPDLDFFVRTEKPRPALVVEGQEKREEENTARFWEQLKEEYHQRDVYEKRKPYRYDPGAWREYQDHLLQAERLYRAHRLDDASAELGSARRDAKRLVDRKPAYFGSLALGIRYAANPGDYEALLRKLTIALEPKQPPTTVASSVMPPKDAAATGEKKPDAPAASLKAPTEGAREPGQDLFLRIDDPSATVRDTWKEYVEGQMIEWMIVYRRLKPLEHKVNLFSDERKDLLVRAVNLRLAAERAAAAALDAKTALRWAVEQGDRHRRIAQDLLFIDQPGPQDRAEKQIVKAEEQYAWAAIYVESRELVGKVQAELPFLSVWHVRQSARLAGNVIAMADDTIGNIAGLALALDAKLTTERSAPEGDDYFRGVAAKRQELDKLYQTLLGDFDADLKSAEKTTDWRPIDDVLLVPIITDERRANLVKRVRTFPHLSADAQGEGDGKTANADVPASDKGAAELGRAALTRSLGRWLFDAANSALDPNRRAVFAPDLDQSWIHGQAVATRTDHGYRRIADGMKKIEDSLQALRRSSAANLDDGFRGLMTWMAGRLLDDADPVRAKRFDGGDAELERRRTPLDQKDWLRRFASDCREPLGVDTVPMKVDVEARQGVPDGVACLFVDFARAQDRGKVELFRGDAPIDRGIEAPLDSTNQTTIQLDVGRGPGDAAEAAVAGHGQAGSDLVTLRPILFYRGRAFDGATGDLSLKSVRSQFIIGIESDKEAIAKDRGIKNADLPADQFTKRPGAVTGFAYPGCFHPSILTILYRADDGKNVEVEVEVRYDDRPEPETKKMVLVPGERTTFAHFQIAFPNARPRDPKVRAEGDKYLRQQKLVVCVWRSGKIGKGKPLVQQTIELSEVNPERFNTVETWTIDGTKSQRGRMVNVRVYRRVDDPVVRPVGVAVRSVDGLTLDGRYQSKRAGRVQTGLRIDEAGQVGLVAGEACTFQFLVASEPKDKKYRFQVIFAGDYTIERDVTVPGAGVPPAPAPAHPADPAVSQ